MFYQILFLHNYQLQTDFKYLTISFHSDILTFLELIIFCNNDIEYLIWSVYISASNIKMAISLSKNGFSIVSTYPNLKRCIIESKQATASSFFKSSWWTKKSNSTRCFSCFTVKKCCLCYIIILFLVYLILLWSLGPNKGELRFQNMFCGLPFQEGGILCWLDGIVHTRFWENIHLWYRHNFHLLHKDLPVFHYLFVLVSAHKHGFWLAEKNFLLSLEVRMRMLDD